MEYTHKISGKFHKQHLQMQGGKDVLLFLEKKHFQVEVSISGRIQKSSLNSTHPNHRESEVGGHFSMEIKIWSLLHVAINILNL